jgi:transposase
MSGTEFDPIFAQIAQHFEAGRVDDAKSLLHDVFAAQDADFNRLKAQLQRLQKRIFGQRTERVPDEQLRLFQDEQANNSTDTDGGDVGSALTEDEEVVVKEHRRRKKERGPIDVSALPVEIVNVPPEQTDCGCGKKLDEIGFEDTRVIERTPASCVLKIYRRPKMVCGCKNAGVTTAPAPEKPISGSMLSFSLLVDVLTCKFALHMPLNRLRRVYAQEGLIVSDKTLSRWVGEGADILNPLAKEIMKRSLAAAVLNTDDTPVVVLDTSAPGGSKKGRLWVYVGDHQWIAFDYTPNWQAGRPRELLRRRARGPTQSDGYAGYDAVYEDPLLELLEVGCWAHAKRKVQDSLVGDKRAAEPLRLIKQLFKLETLADAKHLTPEERLEMRQQRSRPIHVRLEACIKKLQTTLAPKDDLAVGIAYMLNRWEALSRFLDDGRLEMTNNIAERALRRIAVGRANWQFAGSDTGGAWAAVIYTVVATAEAAGVNVRTYLSGVMPRLVRRDYRDIADLLPNAWAQRQAEKPDADTAPLLAS